MTTFIHDKKYFQGYAYSYPHKSAYRPFEQAIDLQDIWAGEDLSSLYLYMHIPFCEMRCGFCNLFTMANPKSDLEAPFLPKLKEQALIYQEVLGDIANFKEIAIGGGTPTFLNIKDLEQLLFIIKNILKINPKNIPAACEMSPKTATADKLALLHENGIKRASIGVQSFVETETKTLGRPQKISEVHAALQHIKDQGFEAMNIDLIYGTTGQTKTSWQYSLEAAVSYQPEEVFLYPLYVRPLTGLGKKADLDWDHDRIDLYRQGRDYLLTQGYEQVTMRFFRKISTKKNYTMSDYNSCKNGMVGLGVGARSYTKNYHYSMDYAVGRKGVKSIIHDYVQTPKQEFRQVNYGIKLNTEEQKRRYVIKSLLENGGLDLQDYQDFFGSIVTKDLKELEILIKKKFLNEENNILKLNQSGLELSDVIGPWLYSPSVKESMKEFEWV